MKLLSEVGEVSELLDHNICNGTLFVRFQGKVSQVRTQNFSLRGGALTLRLYIIYV
jgi:hypothetical protein